jgi:hypothetical protein
MNSTKKFSNYSANPNNPNWENIISRTKPLYQRETDLRDIFERDYTRIIHSTAYRRLKHKTQVFFSPDNDHICTRIEHVTHVDSISHTIAQYLGLNTNLTHAIAVAHDLGHSPFGHAGEKILSSISMRDLGISFWHEKNGLDFVDYIELLEDSESYKQNLNLTYGVRDGIISHCGEIDENSVRPRNDFIDLKDYTKLNQFAPYTWEGCVVKISDKISYVCRDIEDSVTLGILDNCSNELHKLLNLNNFENINNTNVINELVYDLCTNSSFEKGLCFSDKYLNLLNELKAFNYKNIYFCDRIQPSIRYFEVVLNEIYNILKSYYSKDLQTSLNKLCHVYPKLGNSFKGFVNLFYDFGDRTFCKNTILFSSNNEKDFYHCILYYISGMTDHFAIEAYQEIIGF